jgi:hypothetical protein
MGKTVIAGLEYARQAGDFAAQFAAQDASLAGSGQSSLLIVAHQRENLNQSNATFRQVQADTNLGELLVTAPALQPFAPCVRFCAVARWAGSVRPSARHLCGGDRG